jgi:hypothetical protein
VELQVVEQIVGMIPGAGERKKKKKQRRRTKPAVGEVDDVFKNCLGVFGGDEATKGGVFPGELSTRHVCRTLKRLLSARLTCRVCNDINADIRHRAEVAAYEEEEEEARRAHAGGKKKKRKTEPREQEVVCVSAIFPNLFRLCVSIG